MKKLEKILAGTAIVTGLAGLGSAIAKAEYTYPAVIISMASTMAGSIYRTKQRFREYKEFDRPWRNKTTKQKK